MANEQVRWSPPEPTALSIGKGTAELSEIVVFIDGRTETAGILEFAGTLAQEQGASLISVFIRPKPTATTPEMFAREQGIVNVIAVHRAEIEGIEADCRARFEDVVHRHGIRSEWRSLPYLLKRSRPWWSTISAARRVKARSQGRTLLATWRVVARKLR
jgi:hypothetical protein